MADGAWATAISRLLPSMSNMPTKVIFGEKWTLLYLLGPWAPFSFQFCRGFPRRFYILFTVSACHLSPLGACEPLEGGLASSLLPLLSPGLLAKEPSPMAKRHRVLQIYRHWLVWCSRNPARDKGIWGSPLAPQEAQKLLGRASPHHLLTQISLPRMHAIRSCICANSIQWYQ
jgi:hypothetical protein